MISGRAERGCLQLGVTLAPIVRTTIELPGDQSLVLQRLARITPTGTRLGDGLVVAQAIDIDAAGRRAFRQIRGRIAAARGALDGPDDPESRTAWLLLQVTRVLFLRFVETEGWLNGSTTFLTNHLDRVLAAGLDPGRHLLAPLFFGTLNRPAPRRDRLARQFGKVPFLNGGLFEPHPLERAHRWRLSAPAWCELLEPLLEGIEVSLEQNRHRAAITPEMLGRILEGLLAGDERADGGVFYTPPPLVDAVLRETVCCHLALRLGRTESDLNRAIDDPDPALHQALGQLRLLDPAVGSGAFLVSALRLLRGTGPDEAGRTRRVLRDSLHGIDLNPSAVRITELRLWLELVRTMRGTPPERVKPLPNLDTAVRAGDALLDPLAGARLPSRLLASLRRARNGVDSSHGRRHQTAVRELRRLEVAAVDTVLARREARLERLVLDHEAIAAAPNLFDELGALPAKLGGLPRALRRVREQRIRLQDAGSAPAFAVESAWAPELAAGGFDLIVGNPPWVRAERLSADVRSELSLRYRWWRVGKSGWGHLPDISVAFLERAHGLLRPEGTFGLLVPGKLTTTGYAAAARAALVESTTLHVVADLQHDPRAAFDATIYPMAVIATRKGAPNTHAVRLGIGANVQSLKQCRWRGAATWTTVDDETAILLERLAVSFPTIGERFAASIGVKTGANDIFLDPPPSLSEWTRPAIRGRDISDDEISLTHRLLWPMAPNGKALVTLPPRLADFFAPHESRLRNRADQRDGAWWQLFRVGAASSRWRVVWPDIAPSLRAHPLVDGNPVPLNSCYLMATPSRSVMERLAAWLAVGWVGALARLRAEPAAGGYFRFGARVIQSLPCPPAIWHEPLLDPGRSVDPVAREECAARLLILNHDDRARLAPFAPHRR